MASIVLKLRTIHRLEPFGLPSTMRSVIHKAHQGRYSRASCNLAHRRMQWRCPLSSDTVAQTKKPTATSTLMNELKIECAVGREAIPHLHLPIQNSIREYGVESDWSDNSNSGVFDDCRDSERKCPESLSVPPLRNEQMRVVDRSCQWR